MSNIKLKGLLYSLLKLGSTVSLCCCLRVETEGHGLVQGVNTGTCAVSIFYHKMLFNHPDKKETEADCLYVYTCASRLITLLAKCKTFLGLSAIKISLAVKKQVGGKQALILQLTNNKQFFKCMSYLEQICF